MTSSQNVDRDPSVPGAGSRVEGDARDGTPPSFEVCPFLAGGDGSWRSAQPTKSHVCAAVEPPAVLATSKQRQLCLTADHDACATYIAASAIVRRSEPAPYDADLWPATTPRLVTVDPVRTGLAGGLTSPQAKTGGQALLVGLIIIAFVVLVVARTAAPGDAAPDGSPGFPAATNAPAVTGSGSVASPAPAAASQPPAATPVTVPSATPASSPAGELTYKVKSGDTLASIALRFGVTVKAIRTANDLAKGEVLRRGQVLTIPAPAASATP